MIRSSDVPDMITFHRITLLPAIASPQPIHPEPCPSHILRPAEDSRTSSSRQAAQETTREPRRGQEGVRMVQDAGTLGSL